MLMHTPYISRATISKFNEGHKTREGTDYRSEMGLNGKEQIEVEPRQDKIVFTEQ